VAASLQSTHMNDMMTLSLGTTVSTMLCLWLCTHGVCHAVSTDSHTVDGLQCIPELQQFAGLQRLPNTCGGVHTQHSYQPAGRDHHRGLTRQNSLSTHHLVRPLTLWLLCAAEPPSKDSFAPFRAAGCANFTSQEWQPLRPGFHITIPYGERPLVRKGTCHICGVHVYIGAGGLVGRHQYW
jgi:hypothetical protein